MLINVALYYALSTLTSMQQGDLHAEMNVLHRELNLRANCRATKS